MGKTLGTDLIEPWRERRIPTTKGILVVSHHIFQR